MGFGEFILVSFLAPFFYLCDDEAVTGEVRNILFSNVLTGFFIKLWNL